MPRDIPVGNGQLLVNFDHHYQIRDIYFPHVGQENHGGGLPCRFGVWSSVTPQDANDRRRQRLYWTDQEWQLDLGYEPGTLVTQAHLRHDALRVELRCSDVVDFHRAALVRRIEIHNKGDAVRTFRLFHNNQFQMYHNKVGDTAYFDPRMEALIHYRKVRYLMAKWFVGSDSRMDGYATGTAGYFGAEGTWRDAEDGKLGQNAITQGAVDSTMMIEVEAGPDTPAVVYMVIGAAKTHEDLLKLDKFLRREGPQGVIDRTRAYWKLWLDASRIDLPDERAGGTNQRIKDLVERSLLVVRTQIDNNGAIIAANDSDIMQYSRDTYSYLWPRDGALVAAGLDDAGFPDVARAFYSLCSKIIEPGGYFLHKYNPEGSPASSWHPWVSQNEPQLPIQEDETALVIWALWRHYATYRDIEFVRPLWISLIQKAADFLVRFRDPHTNLPLPSYDLWEERWGVHAFTVATVYGGLQAAYRFATCFGDNERSATYARAAQEVRDAFCEHMWSADDGRFLRRIVPLDHERTAKLMQQVMQRNGHGPCDPLDEPGGDALNVERDSTIDASLYAIFAMNLLKVDDERVEQTMRAVEQRLWVKTPVGGVARYENDTYHQTTQDIKAVPGNPWFICTLWLADWYIAKAKSVSELRLALPFLDWAAGHALPSGILAEQVHPLTNAPLSVSPLTWSHATVVATAAGYLRKLNAMSVCTTCGQPHACLLPDEPRIQGDQLVEAR